MTTQTNTPVLSPADQVLNNAKGKFEVVLVIGLDSKNNLDVTSTNNNYPILQWLLNKASFELNIHEKNTTQQTVEQEVAKVSEEVA